MEQEPSRRGLALAALGAVVIALAIGLFLLRRGAEAPGPTILEQATFETRAEPSSATMKDGSLIELAPETRVEVVENEQRSVRLSLRRGRLTCDVAAGQGRSFVVVAAELGLRAADARFTVGTTDMQHGQRVDVNVERGVVELSGRGEPRKVSAGQTHREEPEPPSGLVPPPLPPPQLAPLASASSAPPAPTASAKNAGELLEQANWARRMGQAREAAHAYETLLERFPNDARAGLAAFELGRLRMDSLKDLGGAAQALERAVVLAKDALFREEALARLTEAYAALGQNADCARARDRYLKSHPNGAQKAAVSARCAP